MIPVDVVPIRRAVLSVFDKTGLLALSRGLVEAGVELISTGSTAQALRGDGILVTEVAEVTGFPEMLDGRVKTLHPGIHAGILADRGKSEHVETLAEHHIRPVELVVGNLYPFRETVAADRSETDIIEMIDIGGPTMVRAAAKNHAWVAVVTTPDLYGVVLEELRAHGGTTLATRRRLARQAFAHTASYDADVAAWFARGDELPDRWAPVHHKALDLRYGENPHQQAAWYVERERWGLGSAEQLGGKELSYNNLLDADAAWGMARDFAEPCVAIIKHTNPAGCAIASTLAEAYPLALAGDPVSAYGGIVACNREVDAPTADQIIEVFTEVVVAPSYSEEALDVLRTKANLRILAIARPEPPAGWLTTRSLSGGVLVQTAGPAGRGALVLDACRRSPSPTRPRWRSWRSPGRSASTPSPTRSC